MTRALALAAMLFAAPPSSAQAQTLRLDVGAGGLWQRTGTDRDGMPGVAARARYALNPTADLVGVWSFHRTRDSASCPSSADRPADTDCPRPDAETLQTAALGLALTAGDGAWQPWVDVAFGYTWHDPEGPPEIAAEGATWFGGVGLRRRLAGSAGLYTAVRWSRVAGAEDAAQPGRERVRTQQWEVGVTLGRWSRRGNR